MIKVALVYCILKRTFGRRKRPQRPGQNQTGEPRRNRTTAIKPSLSRGGGSCYCRCCCCKGSSRHNSAQRRTPPAVEDPPALLVLSPALSPAASEPAYPPGYKRQKDYCRRGGCVSFAGAILWVRVIWLLSFSPGLLGRAGPVQPGMEVFVDGVPGGAPRVELCDLFEVAVPGVVVKVALMKQFAFIQLCDEVAVECAIQKLNGHLLHCHRVVVVEFSRPRPTRTVKTFVGNVSATCISGELRVLFQEFGPVIECHIVKGVTVGVGGRTEIDP
ncbi:RNA-binding protein 14-like [Crotalus adamanteus]|uniref:RNA-binding protein 14-like n=1 Tax=Crotalus adamanteus TaxID=8729 RepID=A0AAW1BZ03_CROAD